MLHLIIYANSFTFCYQSPFLNEMNSVLSQDDSLALEDRERLMAQSALESAWGKSYLSTRYNNYFGLTPGSAKQASVRMNTKEYSQEKGFYDTKRAFRVFSSMTECVEARKTYPDKGYATDPQYRGKIRRITQKVKRERTTILGRALNSFFRGLSANH
jgi:flagellum-specific peptidoglycan hydrolase FlgJ